VDWRGDRLIKRGLLEAGFHLEGEETILDISLATGLHFDTVRNFLEALHAAGLIERRW
jgi:predicted ArsR family transcriptional regulator